MKLKFLPKNRSWLIYLFTALIILAIALSVVAEVNILKHPSHHNTRLLEAAIWLLFAVASAAAVVGRFAAKKRDERSVLVYGAISLGSMVLVGILIVLIASSIGAFS